jgi:hypothetical protein
MSDLIWLHEDALNAEHPLFDLAAPGSTACFIWDEAYLRQMNYGFKRLVFIYETLIELPLIILRGPQFECLSRLAGQGSGRILVPATPNPELQRTIDCLRQEFDVEVVNDRPFVSLSPDPDLKRFFRYWKKARKAAMDPGGGCTRGLR